MNNSNFDASKLMDVKVALWQYNMAFNRIYNACDWGSGVNAELLRSEDSNLSNTWATSSELGEKIYKDMASPLISKIWEEFERYIKATVANEMQAADTISSINARLEEDRNKLDQIEI